TRGGGACQQDCPHRLEADGDRGELRRRADAWGIGTRRLRDRPVGFIRPVAPELQEEEMVGSIDPRCETIRGTHWLKTGRVVVGNSRRGSHLGQRSKPTASTGRTYGCKRSDQTTKPLVPRGPSTYGSRRSPGRLLLRPLHRRLFAGL